MGEARGGAARGQCGSGTGSGRWRRGALRATTVPHTVATCSNTARAGAVRVHGTYTTPVTRTERVSLLRQRLNWESFEVVRDKHYIIRDGGIIS